MEKYSIEEIKKAAEIGNVSMVDANHIIDCLDEAKLALSAHVNCRGCKYYYVNPVDEICRNGFNINNESNCGGISYEQYKIE